MSAFKLVRQTLTIARRDFVAMVYTPTFLIFLLAPLLMMSFGAVGGIGAASMSEAGADKARIVAIVAPERRAAVERIDRELRRLYRGPRDMPPALTVLAPSADPAAQARAQFRRTDIEASAVLHGPLDRPTILYGPLGTRTADYLGAIAEQVLRADRAGVTAPLSVATKTATTPERPSTSVRGQAGYFTVFAMFLITLMLAGQAVGTMAEERSNKVIEILAAAVPLESVFLGKLVGMFGVALLFLAFWGTVVLNLGSVLPVNLARAFSGVTPAVGLPMFGLLFFAYFTMAYLLLGAVFLGIGAQASSQREIQMLSLPITLVQVGMFGFAAAAAGQPGSNLALAAELFPLSSPFAMGARAANSAELWPHALALAWQLMWVVLAISIGARLFRRGVLQSAGPSLFGKRRTAVDNGVN